MRKKVVKPKQWRVLFEVGTMVGVCFVYAETEQEAVEKFKAQYGAAVPKVTSIKEED